MNLIRIEDTAYPSLLRNIPGPPGKLHVQGEFTCLAGPCVAIVGSRRATPYGEKVARTLAGHLGALGVITVSGLARGIDTAAHEGALEAGSKTIAVMGTGPDIIYPPQNKDLAGRIKAQGAVVTEFDPGTPGHPWNFPMRNRIISGLSLGTVVVEAGEQSGALITARLAAEQGREVFAVPGPITSRESAGTHRLIAEGAKLVTRVDHILEEILALRHLCGVRPAGKPGPGRISLTSEEQELLKWVSFEPVSIEEILRKSRGGAGRTANTLLSLELKGVVRALPGKRYARN